MNYEAAIAPINELADKYNNEVVYAESKFEKRTGSSEPMKVYVEDGYDDDYYGNGLVGAAKQSFTVKFDTGSSTFFVPGPKCPSNQCIGPTRYNEQGVDEHNTTSIKYGSGSCTGENFLDTVTVAGINVDKTQVVSLTERAGSAHVAPDSLMGLGFGKAKGKPNTFFEDAIIQGKVSTKEFSLYLGRSAEGTGDNSEITIGGRDPAKFTGSPILLPLVNQDHWNVKLTGFSVNGGSLISGTSGTATIDTGTTYVVGPPAVVNALWAAVPGAKAASGGYHTYPCSSKPKITFQLNGHPFLISDEDLAFQKSGDTCTGAIVANGKFSTLITGDSFLKSWYSIYSYDANNGSPAVLLAKSV